MCGIAGIAAMAGANSPDVVQLRRMCDTILHRGPDDEGLEIKDGVGLGMRRLAIIDISGGNQPICNEDGTVRTIFNGEIYNFRELRRNLVAAGHIFRTQSDTEVIVHSYEEYGSEFPKYLNGMFAIALHDIPGKKLLLVRDQLGIKPLYYTLTRNHIVWGSEIKAVIASGLVERNLDIDALGEFLTWEYVPGAGTLFRDIRKLEPGTILEVDLEDSVSREMTYWDIPGESEYGFTTIDEWQEAVDATLSRSVQSQLISDVPLGAFLSGGVDSSLVVAAMGRAKTFSIGFDDPSYNELYYSRKVSEHLGVDHKTEIISSSVADIFYKLMYFMDDPIGDFSIFPTYLVSKLARTDVTVALSGDGGDELFGGYETYLANSKARQYTRIPSIIRNGIVAPLVRSIKPRPAKKGLVNKLKRFVDGLDEPEILGHARWRKFVNDDLREKIFLPGILDQMKRSVDHHIVKLNRDAGNRTPLNRSLYVDVKSYLVDNCLVKTDRMSMAASLEARVPFLDREVVELAFSIPDAFKVSQSETKILLKRLAARHIPRDCVYRPKEGFSIPIKHWLKTEFRSIMEDELNENRIRQEGVFQPEAIRMIKEKHLKGVENNSHILWSLIVFQSWRRIWLEG